MGDANEDGSVDVLDVMQIVGYILSTENSLDFYAADVNYDSYINILDIIGVINIIVNGQSGRIVEPEIVALEVPDIPIEVSRLGQFTVRGELYAFNEFSPKSQRVAAAQLRRIEPECHLLSFIAFQILNSQNDHKENLATLASYDFNIVPYVEANTYDDVKKYHNEILFKR